MIVQFMKNYCEWMSVFKMICEMFQTVQMEILLETNEHYVKQEVGISFEIIKSNIVSNLY